LCFAAKRLPAEKVHRSIERQSRVYLLTRERRLNVSVAKLQELQYDTRVNHVISLTQEPLAFPRRENVDDCSELQPENGDQKIGR
jgi:hypothetical protein